MIYLIFLYLYLLNYWWVLQRINKLLLNIHGTETGLQSYKRIGMSIHLKQHPFMKEGTPKGPCKKVACDQRGHATRSGNPKRRVYGKLPSFSLWNDQPTTHYGVWRGDAETIRQAYKRDLFSNFSLFFLSTIRVDKTLPLYSRPVPIKRLRKEARWVFLFLKRVQRGREREWGISLHLCRTLTVYFSHRRLISAVDSV